MKGDFSRTTFNPKKHYHSVLKQQGRVDVDADWNEQQAIHTRRIETEATDIIGGCGAPLHDAGFHIITIANVNDINGLTPEEQKLAGNQNPPKFELGDFQISAGRYYVDGILCENEQIVPFTNQPDLPDAQPMQQAGLYLIYLDVWHRHLTALDDPLIREKALGGPDTSSRLKTLWQVKVLPVKPESPGAQNCGSPFSAWDTLIAASTGTLNARTQPPDATEQACLLPPSAGYQRLENQLYRAEILEVNPDGTPTFFVWSRDNGTVVTAIKSPISGHNVVVAGVGPDDVLGFANGQWVEIIDDDMELNGQPRQLLQIANVDEATRTITMTTTPPQVDLNAHPKLRRWDQTGDSATQNGVPITFDWQTLEDGIEVIFSRKGANGTPSTYKPGDYWLIPARTTTGEIEWPPYEIPNTNPIAQPPAGIRHYYCRLALAQFDGKTLELQDCRNIFAPLTELQVEKCCAVTLSPGPDWMAPLARLEPSSSAHICFQVGDYLTEKPIKLTGFKSLKITGGGPGTRILAPKSEAAFIFTGCPSVEVSGLYAETGVTGFGEKSEENNLRGVLTFYGCGSVSIDGVALKGADWKPLPGAVRAASCICVEPQLPLDAPKGITSLPTNSVYIRDCDLTVGHFQVGILIVNAHRTQIENNVIAVNPTASKFSFGKLLENRQLRANVRRLLVSSPTLQATPKAKSKVTRKAAAVPTSTGRPASHGLSQATFVAGKTTLFFDTPDALKDVLPGLLAKSAKPLLTESLPVRLNQLADKVLLDPKFRRAIPALVTWFNGVVKVFQSSPIPASQGIVVAGQSATEVRIRDNTVIGAAQGIHVGLSHKDPTRSKPINPGKRDVARRVSMTGNFVQVNHSNLLRTCEGIFVGNCDTLVIEANQLLLSPSLSKPEENQSLPIAGIRQVGLGTFVIIRHNRVSGFLGVSRGIVAVLQQPPSVNADNLTD
jgi:hypothetical protein